MSHGMTAVYYMDMIMGGSDSLGAWLRASNLILSTTACYRWRRSNCGLRWGSRCNGSDRWDPKPVLRLLS